MYSIQAEVRNYKSSLKKIFEHCQLKTYEDPVEDCLDYPYHYDADKKTLEVYNTGTDSLVYPVLAVNKGKELTMFKTDYGHYIAITNIRWVENASDDEEELELTPEEENKMVHNLIDKYYDKIKEVKEKKEKKQDELAPELTELRRQVQFERDYANSEEGKKANEELKKLKEEDYAERKEKAFNIINSKKKGFEAKDEGLTIQQLTKELEGKHVPKFLTEKCRICSVLFDKDSEILDLLEPPQYAPVHKECHKNITKQDYDTLIKSLQLL